MKTCSKCNIKKPFSEFMKDKTKKDWYYSSCKDCYRSRLWQEKMIPAKTINCNNCWKEIKPRTNQISNISWKIYCSRLCEHKAYWETKTHYVWYKKYILQRDLSCFLCWSHEKLCVHHIKTRWSWWKDEYQNLITLCIYCHWNKAHWLEWHKYRLLFQEYTKKFETPKNWDYIMNISSKNQEKIKSYNRDLQKRYYERLKQSDKYKAYKEKQKLYKKDLYRRKKEFEKK